jgi:hypothetical protein
VQAQAGHAVTGDPEESLTNRERISLEYSDLVAMMRMIGIDVVPERVDVKRAKVERFLAYSDSLGLVEPLPQEAQDDESRCAVCGWPLAATAPDGCVRGNCSMRPLPSRWYATERARRESSSPAPQGETPNDGGGSRSLPPVTT